MDFLLLGPVVVIAGGRPLHLARRRERLLLALLLLSVGKPIAMDRLIDLLWDDDPPRDPRAALAIHASRLRGQLRATGDGPGVDLVNYAGGYLIRAEPGSIDANRFESLVAAARIVADPAERVAGLRRALRLWRGDALEDVAGPDLRARMCAHLEEQRWSATELYVDTQLTLGRHEELLPELADLTARHPTRERLVEARMLALHRSDRKLDALAAFDEVAARLADGFGLDPGPRLRALQTAILRDDPLIGWPPPAETPTGTGPRLLPRAIHGWVDRAAPSTRLSEVLDAYGVAILTGMPGTGKTTLAVRWSHAASLRFPDGQLYVNLRGFDAEAVVAHPVDTLRTLLVALGEASDRLPDDLDGLVALYRTRTADRRLLVVLDNARDAAQILPLIPTGARSAVLITSRNRLAGLSASLGARIVELGVFSAIEANRFLEQRLGTDRVAADPAAVAEIAARCATLPLALAIVAANAAIRPTASLAAVAQELSRRPDRLDRFRVDGEADNLDAVFAWSYDQLSPAAAALFRTLGGHPVPELSVWCAISLAGAETPAAEALLRELVDANLLQEVADDRYTMHDLLRSFAQSLAPGDADARRRMTDHYLRTAHAAARAFQPGRAPLALVATSDGVVAAPIADRGAALRWLSTEYDAIMSVLVEAADHGLDEHVWQLVWCLTEYMYNRGRWTDWIRAGQHAVEAARRTGNPGSVALSQRSLARALAQKERYAEAEQVLTESLDTCRGIDDQRGTRLALQILADINDRQGRHAVALGHFEAALTLYEAAGDHAGRAATLNNMGNEYVALGRPSEAIAVAHRALDLFTDMAEVNGQCAVLDTLGGAYLAAGERAEAIGYYQRALALTVVVGDVQLGARIAGQLSRVYRDAGDTAAEHAMVKIADEHRAQLPG